MAKHRKEDRIATVGAPERTRPSPIPECGAQAGPVEPPRWRSVVVLLGAAMLTFLVPSIVFVAVALANNMDALGALTEQFTAERHNLLGISLLALFPCVLLALLVGIGGRFARRPNWPLYALGGAVPIVLVTAFVNYEFWPRYLPSRAFLGFPHGLEFVIGPLFFAPIGVLVGFSVVWILLRTRS
jgi:hypothetical protein